MPDQPYQNQKLKKATPGDKPDPNPTVTAVHNTDTTANISPLDQHNLELNYRAHIKAPPPFHMHGGEQS